MPTVAYYPPPAVEEWQWVSVPGGGWIDLNFAGPMAITTEVERSAVVNLHLGGEYLFTPGFSMSAGFFT